MTFNPINASDSKSPVLTSSRGLMRRLQGRRIVYTETQTGDGFNFFTFENNDTDQTATYMTYVNASGYVDSNGNIWCPNCNNRILLYTFMNWEGDMPVYTSTNQYSFPSGVTSPQRSYYEPSTNTMYLSSFTSQCPQPSGDGELLEQYYRFTVVGL